MEVNNSIIRKALQYLDSNHEKTNQLLKDAIYFKTEDSKIDIKRNQIIFFNNDKIEIYRCEYEIIGIYSSVSRLWTWGWSVPYLSKNSTYTSRKILNYGLDLGPNQEYLKSELITSRFRITNPIQLDIHTAISSYLSQIPTIFQISKLERDPLTDNQNLKDNFFKITKPKTDDEYVSYFLFLIK